MTKNKTRNNTNKNFHSSGLRQKVDQMMDILYAGGVNNPMDSIEQISYLLFLRLLTERDEQLAVLSKKYKRIFSGKWSRYAWGNFVTLTGDQLFDSIRSAIENLHELPDLSDTGRLLFRRATLKIYDRPTLRAVIQSVHDIDLAEHDGADIKGDMYEYLLSKISMSGTNGQFRTPRHIIDFIVEIVDPKPGRRICDPACGTAGFLISAFNHILEQNTSKADLKTGNKTGDKLKPAQWKFLEQQAFTGFDNNDNMVKISILNLYLHKLEKANIDLHNPLTTTRGGTYPGPQYDCILANPPFSGKVQKESILSDLNHSLNTRATELLFIKWFIDHLANGGRAGVIVPEGIIFQSANAYKTMRKILVDNYLYAVLSMPTGVFKPYAGVKTNILFIDKSLSKKTDKILFLEIQSDGFTLTDTRQPINENDLPLSLEIIEKFKLNIINGSDCALSEEESELALIVEKNNILDNSNITLMGKRYKVADAHKHTSFSTVKISEICEVVKGKSPNMKTLPGDYPLVVPAENKKTSDHFDFVGPATCVPLISSTGHGHASIKRLHYIEGEFALATTMCALIPKSKKQTNTKFLFHTLTNKKDETLVPLMKGAANVSLKMNEINDVIIPLPPLKVQKAIVSDIDCYQKIIDGAWQVIDNYKPTIKIAPEWEMVELGRVCKTVTGGTPAKKESKYFENGTIPWLRSGEVAFNKIYVSELFITKEGLNNSSAKIIPADSVLIAMYGATAGQVGLLKFDCAINQAICALLPDDLLMPEYLFLILSGQEKEFKRQSTGGAQQNLSQGLIRNFKIPLPPLAEQKKIVAPIEAEQEMVNANKKLVYIYEQKIKAKIAEAWVCGTSQATVEKKADKTADSGLLITEVAVRYRTDASVACLVLQHFKERGKPIREFHLQKYAYIAQQYLKLPIVSEFQPMAAGPWSSAFKNYACACARQQQWFFLKGRNVEPGQALKAGTAEAEKILGRQRGKVLHLLDDLKRFGDSGLERWATILMVVSQLKSAGKAVTRWNIQEAIDNWSGKRNKEWFTKISVSKAIDGMNQKGWIKLIGE